MRKSQKEIMAQFGGRDPLAEADTKMQSMSLNMLKKLVFIAANAIGSLMNEGDKVSAIGSVVCLRRGVDIVFSAYDTAQIAALSTGSTTGNA